MKTWILKSFVSANGGTNNLTVVMVISGYMTLAAFRGKTAMSRAKTWKRKFDAEFCASN